MPTNGYYDVIGESRNVGDQVVASTSLVYSCSEGFDAHTHDPDFKAIVVCKNGKWSHNVECKSKSLIHLKNATQKTKIIATLTTQYMNISNPYASEK